MGVCGFCWGGYGSTNLCKETTVPGGSEKLIDAQFCAHPSGLKVPDMIVDAVATGVPYSMAVGDMDIVMGKGQVDATEAALRQKVGASDTNNYEIRTYPGCKHGFAVRANTSNKVESDGAELAKVQAIDWFNKYL